MKIIKLIILNFDINGNLSGTKEIWINVNSIFNFQHTSVNETKCTSLIYQNRGVVNSHMHVRETPEEILNLINKK